MIEKEIWQKLKILYTKGDLNVNNIKDICGIPIGKAQLISYAIKNNFVPGHLTLPDSLRGIKPISLINYLKTRRTIGEIAAKFKISKDEVFILMDHFRDLKHNLIFDDNTFVASTNFKSGIINLDSKQFIKRNKFKFGIISDNHLGGWFERLDVLHTLYDIFAENEISMVFNAGNWIEGESHFNKQDIKIFGLTNQINYAVSHYPYREGIKTYFVSGDDHEGWYSQRNVINIGDYFQSMREQRGMYDLEHIGYVEGDIRITRKEDGWDNETWMRVQHPGGGTAYAFSYAAQKIVESLQGGEKPNILILGHFHKFDYCIPRGVHTIQAMCTQDQSIFMRKKKIEAMLGGIICEGNIDEYGILNSVSVTAYTFFDKAFYKGKDKYQKYTK